jgi:hypothetical protein
LNSTEKLIEELSDGIASLMLPFYEGFKDHMTEEGKVMGHYSVLSFQAPDLVKAVPKKINVYSYEPPVPNQPPNPYQKVNFR